MLTTSEYFSIEMTLRQYFPVFFSTFLFPIAWPSHTFRSRQVVSCLVSPLQWPAIKINWFYNKFSFFIYFMCRMLPILGYKPADLLDKSLYDCHHSADSEALMAAFKNGE